MWRFHRKIIFPRWYTNQQNNVDGANQNPISKALILCQVPENKNYSSENGDKKQHADKKDRRCWYDPQFHFCFLRSSFLETAGLVGAVGALCLNVHSKLITNTFENDKLHLCPFSNNVLPMPRYPSHNESFLISLPSSSSDTSVQVNNLTEDKVSGSTHILESIRNISDQYVAAVDNSIGISNLNKNNRKAFRHFQAAARNGSSQAFYNLGLCYELGKGTSINLSRAAFCYRKAAIKGHGMATFNLAMYFMKGLGGLPVDVETAKLLLAQAAENGVPEAQLYLGIEFLENERWADAFAVFDTLAKENIPDGQYYLGMCYENGWGIEINKKLALEFFKKSADQGNEKAVVKVKELSANNKNIVQNNVNSGSGFFVLAIYKMLKNGSGRNPQKNLPAYQANQRTSSLKESPTLSKSSSKNHLHVSASVPELTSYTKISSEFSTKVSSPLYLNLMIPLVTLKNNCESKPVFFIGDSTVKKDSSTNLF